jgi:HK97 family phage major capsid protein
MPTTKELREIRANRWEQMKALDEKARVEARALTVEEQKAWDELDAELDTIKGQIERQEKFEARQKELDDKSVDRSQLRPENRSVEQRVDEVERYANAFSSYLRNGLMDMDPEDRKLLNANLNDAKEIKAALGVGTSSAGGYTVPAGFRDELIRAMKAFGGMLDNATVLHTDSGQTLPWPTVDDTSNVGAILAENTQISQQDVTFGTANLDAYMYTSKLVLVSYQLLNDSAVDVDPLLRSLLAERIQRIWNAHFTTGTGSSQPDGIVTNATTGKTGATGQTASVTYNDLIDLIHSIDPAYRTADCKWMTSDGSLKVVRKLVDGQSRPLWEPSLQAGEADRLLGYPVVINQDMPAMQANAKSIGFGNIRQAYVIRIVNDISVLRLNERYADYLQVGFFAFARADGTLQNANAFKVYANSAT